MYKNTVDEKPRHENRTTQVVKTRVKLNSASLSTSEQIDVLLFIN